MCTDIIKPHHEYTLMCDDIRQEIAGKTTLIGLINNTLIVPELPYNLSKLCFYSCYKNMIGAYRFNFSIVGPTNKCKEIIKDANTLIPEGSTEGIFNVTVSSLEIPEEGEYKVITALIKDYDDGIVCKFEYIFKFKIALGIECRQTLP
jgi:hypothetical protein